MASTKNKKAGKHPSYDKLGMSEARRKKKIAYDKKYSATLERKKYRAKLNKANKDSPNKKNEDKSHTKSGKIVNEKSSKNRLRNGQNGKSSKK
jgi:hypothetical protein